MSLTLDSVTSQEEKQERLAFERFRIQGVFETHARKPETITDVVADYINAIHLLRPAHIFDPIERNDTPAIAIGITEELEQLLEPIHKHPVLPHSGEVFGVFVDYVKDERATMLREELRVSTIPRALTLTLTHFILDGVYEVPVDIGDQQSV